MIYLDNNSTTFIDPRVLEEMNALYRSSLGNPSSAHHFGQKSKSYLALATKKNLALLHAEQFDLYYTSSATEALNMAITGLYKGGHIISSSLEHIATLATIDKMLCPVTYLDPYLGKGAIHPNQIIEAIRPETKMIVLMSANNETGIITDLSEIQKIAKERGILLIVDDVALIGKAAMHTHEGITAFVLSAHKFHGPAGIGFLFVRKSTPIRPLIVGGPQQMNRRAGTESIPLIGGATLALELTLRENSILHMTELRELFEQKLPDEAIIHGVDQPRIANTSNIAFPGVDGESLLMNLDLAGVAASHGSACSSGSLESSHVLRNMGIAPDLSTLFDSLFIL